MRLLGLVEMVVVQHFGFGRGEPLDNDAGEHPVLHRSRGHDPSHRAPNIGPSPSAAGGALHQKHRLGDRFLVPGFAFLVFRAQETGRLPAVSAIHQLFPLNQAHHC